MAYSVCSLLTPKESFDGVLVHWLLLIFSFIIGRVSPLDISTLNLVQRIVVAIRGEAIVSIIRTSIGHFQMSLSLNKLGQRGNGLNDDFRRSSSKNKHLLSKLNFGESVVLLVGVVHFQF